MRWEETNPILSEGEPGWATDAYILKIGDGKLRWNDLPAINVPDIDPEDIDAAVRECKEELGDKAIFDKNKKRNRVKKKKECLNRHSFFSFY